MFKLKARLKRFRGVRTNPSSPAPLARASGGGTTGFALPSPSTPNSESLFSFISTGRQPDSIEQLLGIYGRGVQRVHKMTKSTASALFAYDPRTGDYQPIHTITESLDPYWLDVIQFEFYPPRHPRTGDAACCIVEIPGFLTTDNGNFGPGALVFRRGNNTLRYNCDEVALISALSQEIQALSIGYSAQSDWRAAS